MKILAVQRVELKHDFTAKLRQPSLLQYVKKYIAWQRGDGPKTPSWLMPISINLDLTTACNFHCAHCIDLDTLNTKERYDHETLLASLKNMAERGLRSVIIIGGGEPTLYQKFEEVVIFLKKNGVKVAIVSNGTNNKHIYEVADCLDEKDWVRFSIDAGTNETFSRIHNPRINISLEEICSWVPAIRERNPKVPVGFSFLITWEGAQNSKGTRIISNIDEIVMATRLARKYEFSYISFKPFLTRQNEAEVMDPAAMADFKSTVAQIQRMIEEAEIYKTENFKIVRSTNLTVLEEGTWRDFTNQPVVCHMQALRQVLSPLGLFSCPGYRGVEKTRISNSDAYSNDEKIRTTQSATANILDKFDASHECANITCLFNQANWWLEKAIKGKLNPEDLEPTEERNDWYF